MNSKRSLWNTVGEFLQRTSIHGVCYLVEAKNPIAKVLWLIAISFCMSSAALIIYLNVLHWHNSPAVVTNVHPEVARVSH